MFTITLVLSTLALDDSPGARAAEKLAWMLDSIHSIELVVRSEIHHLKSTPATAGSYNLMKEHYIETAEGQRFLELKGMRGDTVVSRSHHFADGKRFASLIFDREHPDSASSVQLTRRFLMEDRSDRKQIPPPFLYFFVGNEPLQRALKHAQYLGEQTILNRKCDAFLFPSVRWHVTQDQIFTLDRETGIPLQAEGFMGADNREQNRPAWIWTALSFDQVAGHPFVMSSRTIGYDAKHSPEIEWQVRVESLSFNKEYPPSTFWHKDDPNLTVFDAITGKIIDPKSAVDAKNSIAYSHPNRKPPSLPPMQPALPATPPVHWMHWIPFGFLALGGFFLAIAGIMWHRAH